MPDNEEHVGVTENTDTASAEDSTASTETKPAEPAASAAPQEAPAAPAAPAADTPPVNTAPAEPLLDIDKIGLLNEMSVTLSIEIGRAQIKIKDLLKLSKGAIVELDKLAGEPVDIYANGKLISKGNIITANGKYCVRLSAVNEKSKKDAEDKGGSDGK